MMKNFIFILLVGYAAGRVMSDDNFSGPDFALSDVFRPMMNPLRNMMDDGFFADYRNLIPSKTPYDRFYI